MSAGNVYAVGHAAAYHAVVEERLSSIYNIFQQFEASDRDRALVDEAQGVASDLASRSVEELRRLGETKGDRDWLKADLAAWADRVLERQQNSDTTEPSSSAGFGGEEALPLTSSAFGVDYCRCVKRLRELGLRMLQLASMGDRRELAEPALRSEIDRSLHHVAEFSHVVHRGLRDVESTQRTETVHTSDVHRSAALQQRLISRLEAQVAEQEALIDTLRKEADDSYALHLRGEERIRQVTIALTQRPPQRHKAVDCALRSDTCDMGVQVQVPGHRNGSAVELLDEAALMTAAVARTSNRPASASSRAATASVTPKPGQAQSSGLSSTGGNAHPSASVAIKTPELLLLQNKFYQQKFLLVSLLALHRRAAEHHRATKRSRFVQTDVSSVGGPGEDAELPGLRRGVRDFIAHTVAALRRWRWEWADGDGIGNVCLEVVHALDALMLQHRTLDLVDLRMDTLSIVSQEEASAARAADRARATAMSLQPVRPALDHGQPPRKTVHSASSSAAPRRRSLTASRERDRSTSELRVTTSSTSAGGGGGADSVGAEGNVLGETLRSTQAAGDARHHAASGEAVQRLDESVAAMQVRATSTLHTLMGVLNQPRTVERTATLQQTTQTEWTFDGCAPAPVSEHEKPQCVSLVTVAAATQTDATGTAGYLGSAFSCAVVVDRPRPTSVLAQSDESPAQAGSADPLSQGLGIHKSTSEFASALRDDVRTRPHQPEQKSLGQTATMRRPSSAVDSSAARSRRLAHPLTSELDGVPVLMQHAVSRKSHTTVHPRDEAHLVSMDMRCEAQWEQFEAFRSRLEMLREHDAEMVLAAPLVEKSSHHFHQATVERTHQPHPIIPPRLSPPPAALAAPAADEPLTELCCLTPRGLEAVPPHFPMPRSTGGASSVSQAKGNAAAAPPRPSSARPQPFVVPPIPTV